ncbi:hypothetical protein NW762_005569 [Fusarium torreyae]|uniref:Galactosyl transferase GMA12/MNN10 family protein n=1 Tax=Fusarium torreyae TaxID=1237075 RepID=A0A9W8S3G0_9HYPO|nr:hypothetical protein NW762_005569 [Fusarium torreyae]
MLQLMKLPWSSASLALKVVVSFFALLFCYQIYSFYGDWDWSHSFNGHTKESISLIHPHGGSKCLPSLTSSLFVDAKSIRKECQQITSYAHSDVRIGRVTAHFGTVETHYQKALRTHVLHSMIHGTHLDVMCTSVVDSLWNKPAFILSLLLDEMMKPVGERLEWLFWVDRDTLILDQCRPITSFLPPDDSPDGSQNPDDFDNPDGYDAIEVERREEKADDKTHLIVTNDWNGLNNGVFLVRVNQWAIELFSAITAFRYYRPNVSLPFTEQSAMEIVMNETKFRRNVQIVPQWWFNTYPKGTPAEFEDNMDKQDLKGYHARRGDFLLHFAGRGGRDSLINEWTSMLDRRQGVWAREEVQRNATRSISIFWSRYT